MALVTSSTLLLQNHMNPLDEVVTNRQDGSGVVVAAWPVKHQPRHTGSKHTLHCARSQNIGPNCQIHGTLGFVRQSAIYIARDSLS